MTVVSFNFTKIEAEKKEVGKGKININNNVTIDNVEEKDLSLGSQKQKVLNFGKIYKFSKSLMGSSLGHNFGSHTKKMKNFLLSQSRKYSDFGYDLGFEVGYFFIFSNSSDQKLLFNEATTENEFSRGFARGLGEEFRSTDIVLNQKISQLVKSNSLFADGYGFGMGSNFSSAIKSSVSDVT